MGTAMEIVERGLPFVEEEDDYHFTFEDQMNIEDEPFIFEGGRSICRFYLQGQCHRGTDCPYRHNRVEKNEVCKHWLRGLCKKNKQCEFLHVMDKERMPPCHFFVSYGECSNNEECPFRHVTPDEHKSDCPWFERGFCKHGPKCRHYHRKKEPCVNYMAGFCPKGPACEFGHPKFESPTEEELNAANLGSGYVGGVGREGGPITCHRCGQQGHKANVCPLAQGGGGGRNQSWGGGGGGGGGRGGGGGGGHSGVICYKCNEPGHYANRCPN